VIVAVQEASSLDIRISFTLARRLAIRIQKQKLEKEQILLILIYALILQIRLQMYSTSVKTDLSNHLWPLLVSMICVIFAVPTYPLSIIVLAALAL
jgi:hypothetical protein